MKRWIDQLPANLKLFMGKVIIPDDDGLAISEAIVEGEYIGASDGSLIKEFRKQKGHTAMHWEKRTTNGRYKRIQTIT